MGILGIPRGAHMIFDESMYGILFHLNDCSIKFYNTLNEIIDD